MVTSRAKQAAKRILGPTFDRVPMVRSLVAGQGDVNKRIDALRALSITEPVPVGVDLSPGIRMDQDPLNPRETTVLSPVGDVLLELRGLSLPPASDAQEIARAESHQVVLLRGIFNVFSLGLDDLAVQLKRDGIRAIVKHHSGWRRIARRIIAEAGKGRRTKLIIVGHSLGANAALAMTAKLQIAAAGFQSEDRREVLSCPGCLDCLRLLFF